MRPERQSPRDRIHSYAVWETAVFLLNVLAFLLMGLQARAIIPRFEPDDIWQALGFAAAVVARRGRGPAGLGDALQRGRATASPRFGEAKRAGRPFGRDPGCRWCGMRGLVTLATALALPAEFPAAT